MNAERILAIQRRSFLKLAGAMTALSPGMSALGHGRRIDILLDPDDPVVASTPVQWAAGQLREVLVAKGTASDILHCLSEAEELSFMILVARPTSVLAK